MVSLSGQGFWTTGRWRWLGESKGKTCRSVTQTLKDVIFQPCKMVSLSGQGFWTTGRWRWLGESKGEDLSKRDSNLERYYTPTLRDGFARIVRKVRLLEKTVQRTILDEPHPNHLSASKWKAWRRVHRRTVTPTLQDGFARIVREVKLLEKTVQRTILE